MTAYQTNWAGNITFGATKVHHPTTVEQLQEIVSRSPKVKVFGARHSFNGIADSAADHLSLDQLDSTVAFDRNQRTVTVNGAITYGQLCRRLHEEGFALHNTASLPHITLAGACATATHGSGDGNGNLATAVTALELVKADGELVTLSRQQDGETFEGAVVGLGGLGVVTRMTLDTVPLFIMQQEVYENLPVAQLEEHFDEITASAYSVSLFTDWQQDRVNQVWLKRRLPDERGLAVAPNFFGATVAPAHRHPVVTLSAAPCTEQMGIPGPWYDRLPHFRVDHTPASGDELQTEYFVPRQYAVEAMRAVTQLQKQMEPILWISEVRTIAADRLWLSPNYGQPSVGLHFSWRRNWPAVQKLLPLLEEQLAPFQARPHWGKLFAMSPSHLQSLYPKLADFRELLRTFDPQGKFRNVYLDTYLFGAD
ncbi:MAG: FAD-binding protein [Chloroflexi bacterium]|nr:MAG: FAD-binding protein [Chloroflexota bacterium]